MQISLIIVERTEMTPWVYSHAIYYVLTFDIFIYVTHLVYRKVSINVLLYHVIYLNVIFKDRLTGIDDSFLVCGCLGKDSIIYLTTYVLQKQTIHVENKLSIYMMMRFQIIHEIVCHLCFAIKSVFVLLISKEGIITWKKHVFKYPMFDLSSMFHTLFWKF